MNGYQIYASSPSYVPIKPADRILLHTISPMCIHIQRERERERERERKEKYRRWKKTTWCYLKSGWKLDITQDNRVWEQAKHSHGQPNKSTEAQWLELHQMLTPFLMDQMTLFLPWPETWSLPWPTRLRRQCYNISFRKQSFDIGNIIRVWNK